MERLDLDQIVSDFERDGFVRLEGLIAPQELQALREDSQLIIEGGYHNKPNPSDYFYANDPETGEEVFHRVQFIFPKAQRHNSFVALLGHPEILDIVQRLLGDDMVCSGEALVFKLPNNGREVAIHCDCNPADPGLSTDHLFFNIDIYLDDATSENGCLLVAPGSHKLKVSNPDLAQIGFNYPGLVEVPMRAGDVLLHNTRLVHGSHKSYAPTLRRTIYYEFHSMKWLVKDGIRPGFPVNQQWTQERLQLLKHAVELRQQQCYTQGETPFPYRLPVGYNVSDATPVNYRPGLGYNKYY